MRRRPSFSKSGVRATLEFVQLAAERLTFLERQNGVPTMRGHPASIYELVGSIYNPSAFATLIRPLP